MERKANYTFSFKNGKSYYSLLLVKKGEMEYTFTTLKKRVLLKEGVGLFIPPNLPYKAVYLRENTTINMLTFNAEKSEPLSHLDGPIEIHSPELTLVFSTISKKNMYSPLFLTAKICELLYYLEDANHTIPQKYKKLLPALLELKQQYFKNEKISYYANLCGMSESNFRKLFKEYTGNNPITYRNLIRISALETLLNTSETTISEAAYIVGFSNMSFFYEVYKKYRQK